jgi:hypothetical protein
VELPALWLVLGWDAISKSRVPPLRIAAWSMMFAEEGLSSQGRAPDKDCIWSIPLSLDGKRNSAGYVHHCPEEEGTA